MALFSFFTSAKTIPQEGRKVQKQNCVQIGREQTQIGMTVRRRIITKFHKKKTESKRNITRENETICADKAYYTR